MDKKNLYMNYITLLSALLFSLAFIFINNVGFLVIPALLLLGLIFIQQLSLSFFSALGAGFVWGLVVFGIHFFWLLKLLLTKSHASLTMVAGLYGFIVIYLALTSAIWFAITFLCCIFISAHPVHGQKTRALMRLLFFVATTTCYFTFLNHYSFWFLGSQEGYPFLSPCVPLASYNWFLNGLAMKHSYPEYNYQILPSVTFIKPTTCKDNAKKAAYDIFHTFSKSFTSHSTIYVGPESAYPYSLNQSEESIKLWRHYLPTGSNFLLGAHHAEEEKIYQAVYWLESGRIKSFYVKKYAVPLVEKIPQHLKKYNSLKNIFIQKTKEFSEGVENKVFDLSPTCNIIPLVCSEFFFKTNTVEIELIKRKYANCQLMIFLFINDSWFVDYFKKIMENVTYLRAAEFGLPILLVTHTGCKEIIPSLIRKES